MNIKRIAPYLMVCGLVVILPPLRGLAQQNSDAAKTSVQPTPTERDGQHDFDPLIGSWKYHLKRRLHPLTGSTTWVEFDGSGVCRKVYEGASVDQIEVDGPSGHIEGLTLRVYNLNPTSGDSIGPTARLASSTHLKSDSSRTGTASFSPRTQSTAKPSLFDLIGRTRPRICRTSNSHSPMTAEKPGK